jgi:hypothetical protein
VLKDVSATLDVRGADVTGGPVSFGDIPAQAEAIASTPFTVHLHEDVPVVTETDCEASTLFNGVDFDSHKSGPFVGTGFVVVDGVLHVTSGDKKTDFPSFGTTVCAIRLGITTPTDQVAATGGIRFDLLWLALGILACGAVLRRSSTIKA